MSRVLDRASRVTSYHAQATPVLLQLPLASCKICRGRSSYHHGGIGENAILPAVEDLYEGCRGRFGNFIEDVDLEEARALTAASQLRPLVLARSSRRRGEQLQKLWTRMLGLTALLGPKSSHQLPACLRHWDLDLSSGLSVSDSYG